MKAPKLAIALCISLALSGCLYANVREPLSYRSPTPADVASVGDEVHGEACNHVILWLLAFGDGGYDAAVADARASAHAPLLADVKADTELLNVIGVYQRQCTTVAGRVASLSAASTAAAASAPVPSAPASTGTVIP